MNAPNPTHTFTTRADLEATCGDCVNFDECCTCYAEVASNPACDHFRRVTLAYQHLPTPPAPKEGGGV